MDIKQHGRTWTVSVRLVSMVAICLLFAGTLAVVASGRGKADAGDIIPVSTSAHGVIGNYGSGGPFMTPEGRYVAFGSVATNLTSSHPPDGTQAIYWKDLMTGAVKLVSASTAGVPAVADSFVGGISHDGRFVVFFSYDPALVSPAPVLGSCWVFRKDMTTGTVTLVSTSSAGVVGDGYNWFPTINADGNMVAFMSDSGNLVTHPPTSTNIYLKNISTGKTALLSTNEAGTPGNEVSTFPKINADGRYVSFLSASSNFVTPAPSGVYNQVYRKDTETGEIVLVSSNASGAPGNNGSDPAVLDHEGRFAIFPSMADNLVTTATTSGIREIYVKDINSGTILLASCSKTGNAGNGNSDEPDISSEGRYVSFESMATNLVSPAASGDYFQVYRKDLYTGDVVMASTSSSGEYGDDNSAQSSITPDGKFIAFSSTAGNLISPSPPDGEVYRKELPVPPTSWYLAEGTNAWGFNTYISIENPNNEALTARLTYLDQNAPASGAGTAATRTITLPPLSQTCVSSQPDIGNVDFSTRVECLEGKRIAVDRTMYWIGEGFSQNQAGYHNSIGAASPSKTWYLPEGSSAWGFETWTLVENPNASPANVAITYMTGDGPVQVPKTVGPNSRASFNMASDIGAADASIKVTSSQPVIAERSMYRDNRREGSCSIGATTLADDYFLAEGAVGYDVGFTTYVLIQNPGNEANDVTVTYQTQSGEVEGPAFTMPPGTRKTVCVNDQLPAGTNVST
ncbi:MAG: hypothetical protein JXA49_03130, partial [Actinobacteria bacterium]|nr:hypothetical protein [Actinomycetota bacterium]